jgi:GR25 family glycosyltransferase involved in LPS biosynthesis
MITASIPIYIINLKSRVDRHELVILELQKIFKDVLNNIEFIEALYTPRNGAIGCSTSHAYAMSQFLYKTDAPCCLIIEDDFECDDPDYFIQCFTSILKTQEKWDVALFAHNQAIEKSQTSIYNLKHVLNSQTASAYMINRHYAPDLVSLFYKSSILLNSGTQEFHNKISNHLYAIDMLWKNEQIFRNYLAFFPPASRQRLDFSNIENKTVDYKV